MNTHTNHISLKWGTLKEWNFSGLPEAQELFKKYCDLGSSASAMMQDDSPEQKEIICKLIDLMPGDIYLDWDDRYVSKDEAKKYVREYGQPKAA